MAAQPPGRKRPPHLREQMAHQVDGDADLREDARRRRVLARLVHVLEEAAGHVVEDGDDGGVAGGGEDVEGAVEGGGDTTRCSIRGGRRHGRGVGVGRRRGRRRREWICAGCVWSGGLGGGVLVGEVDEGAGGIKEVVDRGGGQGPQRGAGRPAGEGAGGAVDAAADGGEVFKVGVGKDRLVPATAGGKGGGGRGGEDGGGGCGGGRVLRGRGKDGGLVRHDGLREDLDWAGDGGRWVRVHWGGGEGQVLLV